MSNTTIQEFNRNVHENKKNKLHLLDFKEKSAKTLGYQNTVTLFSRKQ